MDTRRVIRNLSYLLAIGLAAFGITIMIHGTAPAKNFLEVVCDGPDSEQCQKIHDWYRDALVPKRIAPYGSSCCGLGDAYWADEIDEAVGVGDQGGFFVRITDDRDCKPGQVDACIKNRVPMNGKRIYVPNMKIDDRFYGNPTGHNVVYVGGNSFANYQAQGAPPNPDNGSYLWPTVYCFFPDIGL